MYLMITIAAFWGFVPIVAMAAVLFMLNYDGRWLIAGAILLDAYFGAFSAWPLYSLAAMLLYGLIETLKPFLRTM